jgi:hypothetical protein
MRDYEYEDEDGRTMVVAQMPLKEIFECLAPLPDFELHSDDDVTVAAILKRLDLELFIRLHNLRGDSK